MVGLVRLDSSGPIRSGEGIWEGICGVCGLCEWADDSMWKWCIEKEEKIEEMEAEEERIDETPEPGVK